MEERYIAAIDLGTAKIALTVARVCQDDVQVIYYKETPSDGIRYSYVFNISKVEKPLMEAIKDAERELKIKILQVVVGMPRYSVQVETATGRIDRDGDASILQEEVDNLKEMAVESYPLNDTRSEILYGAVAQSFSTEYEFQQLESDIVGMVSNVLEGNFKVFIGQQRHVKNIDMVMNDLNIAIAKKYFVPDVTAKAVLTNEEMENGVALIDFGAGTTSVSVYKGKIMRHYASIPFGGKSITTDICTEASIDDRLAENIKLAYGALIPNKLQTLSEKVIQINDENDVPIKQIPVKYLSEVMTARTQEILDAVFYEIEKSGFADSLKAGVVVTGGCANLANLTTLIKDMSGYTARPGFARHLFSYQGCSGVCETSATASLGMVLAAKNERLNCIIPPEPDPVKEAVAEPVQETIEAPVTEVDNTMAEVAAPVETAAQTSAEVNDAIKYDPYAPQSEPAEKPKTIKTGADYFEPGFSFDGPTPHGEPKKAATTGSLFSEEELPAAENPKPKQKKTKEPKKPGFLISWIKKGKDKVEESIGNLYENLNDE